MPQTPPLSDLPGSLDTVHLRIREAFRKRDLVTYGQHLAEDLVYVEANGRVQNRRGLLRSVRRQFARLVSFTGQFDRDSLILENGDAVETGTQTARIALRVFLFLEIRWCVTRHGRYSWRRDMAVGWVLRHVVLDQEKIRRESIGLPGGTH